MLFSSYLLFPVTECFLSLSLEAMILQNETAGTESENTEGSSKEELGRLVASRWTGEK